MNATTSEEAIRRRIAIHEAGHAVVAVGLQLTIDSVTLLDGGRTYTIRDHDWETPSPWGQIALSLAGIAAEKIADPRDQRCLADRYDGEARHAGEFEYDLHTAERSAVSIYGSPSKAWRAIGAAYRRVTKWLRRPAQWACVEAIATRLLDGEVTDVYSLASNVKTRDRALLPKGRPFFMGELEDSIDV